MDNHEEMMQAAFFASMIDREKLNVNGESGGGGLMDAISVCVEEAENFCATYCEDSWEDKDWIIESDNWFIETIAPRIYEGE